MKGRIKRLAREAASEGFLVRLRDGGTKFFDDHTCSSEMFLTQTDLLSGVSRDSAVLDAVRAATPESRAAFEEQYGPLEMEVHVICPEDEGGWVEVLLLREDGTLETVRHVGGSEEAERMRREAREGPAAF